MTLSQQRRQGLAARRHRPVAENGDRRAGQLQAGGKRQRRSPHPPHGRPPSRPRGAAQDGRGGRISGKPCMRVMKKKACRIYRLLCNMPELIWICPVVGFGTGLPLGIAVRSLSTDVRLNTLNVVDKFSPYYFSIVSCSILIALAVFLVAFISELGEIVKTEQCMTSGAPFFALFLELRDFHTESGRLSHQLLCRTDNLLLVVRLRRNQEITIKAGEQFLFYLKAPPSSAVFSRPEHACTINKADRDHFTSMFAMSSNARIRGPIYHVEIRSLLENDSASGGSHG